MLRELGAAAAFALVEGVQQVAAAALLAKTLALAGAVELRHLDVHLRTRKVAVLGECGSQKCTHECDSGQSADPKLPAEAVTACCMQRMV